MKFHSELGGLIALLSCVASVCAEPIRVSHVIAGSSIEIGSSWNSLRGVASAGAAFGLADTSKIKADAPDLVAKLRLVDSSEEATRMVNGDAKISGSWITGSASADFTFNSIDRRKSDELALVFNIRATTRRESAPMNLSQLTLNDDLKAIEVAGRPRMSAASFIERYGDGFVRTIVKGAQFTCVARLKFTSEYDRSQFKQTYEASFLDIVNGNAQIDQMKEKYGSTVSVTVDVHAVGSTRPKFVARDEQMDLNALLTMMFDYLASVKLPNNDTVIGYEIESYKALAGMSVVVNEDLPDFLVDRHVRELERLFEYKSILNELPHALPPGSVASTGWSEGTALPDASAIVQLTSASLAEQCANRRIAIDRFTTHLTENGALPTEQEISEEPTTELARLELATDRSAREYLRGLAAYRAPIEISSFIGVEASASPEKPAEVLAGDPELDTQLGKWTRVRFLPSIAQNGPKWDLKVKMQTFEGVKRFALARPTPADPFGPGWSTWNRDPYRNYPLVEVALKQNRNQKINTRMIQPSFKAGSGDGGTTIVLEGRTEVTEMSRYGGIVQSVRVPRPMDFDFSEKLHTDLRIASADLAEGYEMASFRVDAAGGNDERIQRFRTTVKVSWKEIVSLSRYFEQYLHSLAR